MPAISLTNDSVPALVDDVDADLAGEQWYLHARGYVYRRPVIKGVRQLFWLHKVIVKRQHRLKEMPAWVRFKNGDGRDCRRDNLILVRRKGKKEGQKRPKSS